MSEGWKRTLAEWFRCKNSLGMFKEQKEVDLEGREQRREWRGVQDREAGKS